MYSVISIDVEEWFHILETESLSKNHNEWTNYPSRIEQIFETMLCILEENEVKATLFFLGWIAEKYPVLVKRAHEKGHEIAAHGYYHKLIYEQSFEEFYSEMSKTKDLLEKIIGENVIGLRAPGFSITKETTWAYKALIELGFKYSSSVYPAKRAHGSYEDFGLIPKKIYYKGKSIVEFPISVLKFPFTSLSCFGGGYFRLFPLFWFKFATKLLYLDGRPLIFYIHPRDIDKDQPLLPLPWRRRIKCYINISSAKKKFCSVLRQGEFKMFSQIIEMEKFKKKAGNNFVILKELGPESSGLFCCGSVTIVICS